MFTLSDSHLYFCSSSPFIFYILSSVCLRSQLHSHCHICSSYTLTSSTLQSFHILTHLLFSPSLSLSLSLALSFSLSLSLSCSLFGLPSVMVSLLFPFVSIRCLLRYLSAGLCMLQLCESAIRCKELPVGGDTFFQIISLDLEGSNCFGPDVF